MAVFKEFNPVEHDRSIEDRRRHRQLVEKAIKENLGDILSEESIVGESKNKNIKIPIRGLKEYQFIYGKNVPGVGSGSGKEKRGDKLGSDKDSAKGKGGAGNNEGEDVYETEITIEEVISYLMEDLELPDMDKKKFSEILTHNSKKRSGYQKYGIKPRLSKKKTMIEKIKRAQGMKRALNSEDKTLTGNMEDSKDGENSVRTANMQGKLQRFPFKEDDLRYHRIKETYKKESNAAIIFIMDTSGSMDNTKKYIARSFFFILSKFIRMKYVNVQVAFVAHTTVAKEVDEAEFFHKVESGGTYISSGMNKALEIIKERFDPSSWNLYSFYVSDGDNWSEDDANAIKAAGKLSAICNLFGYAEIMAAYYSSSIKEKLIKEVKRNNFIALSIKQKEDLWKALREMLKKEVKEG